MLSHKGPATEVEKMMRDCSATLDESVRRRVIGKIMGWLYVDVMLPIHRQYPDLEPEELRRS